MSSKNRMLIVMIGLSALLAAVPLCYWKWTRPTLCRKLNEAKRYVVTYPNPLKDIPCVDDHLGLEEIRLSDVYDYLRPVSKERTYSDLIPFMRVMFIVIPISEDCVCLCMTTQTNEEIQKKGDDIVVYGIRIISRENLKKVI
jgi:hypothetical protein